MTIIKRWVIVREINFHGEDTNKVVKLKSSNKHDVLTN